MAIFLSYSAQSPLTILGLSDAALTTAQSSNMDLLYSLHKAI